MGKLIINHYLREIINIIDKLLVIVKKRYDV